MICPGNRFLFCCLVFLLSAIGFRSRAVDNSAAIGFTNYASFERIGAPAVLDLNSDGRLDLVATEGMHFYYNRGTNFTVLFGTNYEETADIPLPVEVADFDNDNDVDMFFSRRARTPGSPSVIRVSSTIFRNVHGAMTNLTLPFTNSPAVPFIVSRRGAAGAADFDNDGDQDLLITGSTNFTSNIQGRSISQLYCNNGDGSFALHPMRFPGVEEGAVSWADYDSDGDFDLFLCGITNSGFRTRSVLYRNNSGQFQETDDAFPGVYRASVNWGDFDNDGDLDLLLAGKTNALSIAIPRLYRNDAGALKDTQMAFPNLQETTAATWSDFDSDGDLDIVVTQAFLDGQQLHMNNGDGTFQAPIGLRFNAGQSQVGDFNNDAKPDVLTYNSRISIARNITAATNTAPVSPSNLQAISTGNSITFSWSPSSDAEQTSSFTYNLRVGSAPNRSDILSAMANLTNGTRFVPRLGNTGLRTNWTIRNLASGTYYWSVQAVDHSLGASGFSTEESITLSNAPPAVNVLSIDNISATSAVVLGRIHPGNDATIIYLEFGTTNYAERTQIQSAPASSTTVEVRALLPWLEPQTHYQFRLVASNAFGASVSVPLAFTTSAHTPATELPVPFPVLRQTPGAAAVDFDNDGDLDIVHCGSNPTNNTIRDTTLYLNSFGVFTKSPVRIPTPRPGSPVQLLTSATDFNNDDLPDFLYPASAQLAVLLSNADGTYREVLNDAFPFIQLPVLGDADNDGDIDILVPRADSTVSTALFTNDGLDRLRRASFSSLKGEFADLGDYDNDGDSDVLLWGRTNINATLPFKSITRILRNDGPGLFVDAEANLPSAWTHASWGDYDNDGDLDVVIAGPTNNGAVMITNSVHLFRNDGGAQFTEVETGVSTGYVAWAQSADFNADGLLDLLTWHEVGIQMILSLHLNTGDLHFTNAPLPVPPMRAGSALVADFDGDKVPDLLVNAALSNLLDYRLILYHNNSALPPGMPPTPTNLNATVDASSANLRWELPNATNQTRGLSFNLRIGATPGGTEIASPMSHHVSGYRRLPEKGNAGQGLAWSIHDLPPGTYYWSVQSINHAHIGSAFAPESTFIIPASERPLRIVQARTSGPARVHQLIVEGPVRARAQLETSRDLLDWTITPVGYIYFPARPATVSSGVSESAFYRLRILEDPVP